MPSLDGQFPDFLSDFTSLTDLYMFDLPGVAGTIPSGLFHPELQRLWVACALHVCVQHGKSLWVNH